MARKQMQVSVPEAIWEQWLAFQREKQKAGEPPPTFSSLVSVALTDWFNRRKKSG